MGRVAAVVLVAAACCAVAFAGTRRAPTDPGWTESHPSWSPDGSQILFSRHWAPPKDAGYHRLGLVGRDGRGYGVLSQPRPPNDPYDVWDLGADWSPDGKRLLVTRRLGMNDDIIYVKDVATGAERRLTPPGVHELGAGWSKDGSRIAFVRLNRITSEAAVYTSRVDGSDKRRVTGGGDIFGATWIRGKDSILVHRLRRDRDGGTSIVPAGGGAERQLTPRGRWHVADVSADGARLLLIRDYGEARPTVWVIGIDGRGLRRLTLGEDAEWSPDGRRIAIVRVTRNRDISVIYVMNADGSGLRRLHVGKDPAWSPDGRRIAFAYTGECEGIGIFVINVGGGGAKRLTNGCRLVGTSEADVLLGTAGRDVIRAVGGKDTVRATPRNAGPPYYGWGDDDDVDGGVGRDAIVGARGSDVLRGGPGNDRLYGGSGADRLFGGASADLLVAVGRGDRDRLDCGPGRDTAIVDDKDVIRGCERLRQR